MGRLVNSANGNMRTGYKYDDYARMVRRSYKDTVFGDGYETYTYDTNTSNAISDGTLTSMRTVSGDLLHYTYDSLMRLTDKYITDEVWERYTYNGTRVASKKNWIGDTLIHTYTYAYDAIGNITGETLNGSTTSYTYDKLNQLTQVKKDGVAKETYAYDNAGNITSFNNGSGKNYTLTYADIWGWKDLLTSVTKNGTTHDFTYDNLGNPLTYYNGYSLNYYFTWTEGRRLATYTYNEETTAYEYDHTGLRTKKTNPDGTYFVYHIADGRYVGETRYNSNNAPYLYMQYIYDESDSIYGISLWQPGQSTAWEHYYFVKNLQGDVQRIYRASDNALVATYSYDAWGNVLSNSSFQTFYGRAVSQLNPFRYRGYYFDNETYFYYLQSRYYDPAIGRFINADGIVSTGQGVLGYNMFAYCGNNPVNRVDPSGNSWIGALIVLGIAVCTLLSGCSDQSSSNVGAAPEYYDIGESDGDRSSNPNCYSYAIGYYNQSYDPGDFSTPFTSLTVDSVADAVESDLKALNRGCRPIDSYDSPISDNEYRIALRVSKPKTVPTPFGTYIDWDYHFMVQTSSGNWAEKHGPGGVTVYHTSGNPSTISWDCGNQIGYYTSEIRYFAITN